MTPKPFDPSSISGWYDMPRPQKECEEFVHRYPHLWKAMRDLCRDVKEGRHTIDGIKLERVGIDYIINRVRWEVPSSKTGRGYKISNDLKPWLARRLMAKCSDLRGFFKTKAMKCDSDEEIYVDV